MTKRNKILKAELIDNLQAQRRLLEDSLKKLDGRPIDAEEAIEFAIGIDDHFDRLEFLVDYQHGDWDSIRLFMEKDAYRG